MGGNPFLLLIAIGLFIAAAVLSIVIFPRR